MSDAGGTAKVSGSPLPVVRWYQRPAGEGLELRRVPRLASWDRADHPDQVRLRDYLEDTAELLAPTLVSGGPWALALDVGLRRDRALLDMADLDNYAFPLACRLRNDRLVSVWCTKQYADVSRVLVAPARAATAPDGVVRVRTTASTQTRAFKEQIRSAVAGTPEIVSGPVHLQLSFVVGPSRNWINLWKPTIDALDPLLGRTHADRDWHPQDGRITELALHVAVDPSLGYDVVVNIAAAAAATPAPVGDPHT